MTMHIGGKGVDSLYLGGKQVAQAYLGGKLVYSGRYLFNFTGRIWPGAGPAGTEGRGEDPWSISSSDGSQGISVYEGYPNISFKLPKATRPSHPNTYLKVTKGIDTLFDGLLEGTRGDMETYISVVDSPVNSISQMIIDSEGNIYARTYNWYIFKVPADGSGIISYDKAPVRRSFEDMAVDSQGNIYVVFNGDAGVYKIETGTTNYVKVGDDPGKSARRLTVDPQGNLYITVSSAYRIYKLAAGTSNFEAITSPAPYPVGSHCDSQGNLYIGFAYGGVYKVAVGTTTFTKLSGYVGDIPNYISTDAQGNLFVLDTSYKIYQKVPVGTNSFIVLGKYPNGTINKVAFDNEGNAYVLGLTSDPIIKLSADTEEVVQYPVPPNRMGALIVDANNVLYTGSRVDGNIYQLNTPLLDLYQNLKSNKDAIVNVEVEYLKVT